MDYLELARRARQPATDTRQRRDCADAVPEDTTPQARASAVAPAVIPEPEPERQTATPPAPRDDPAIPEIVRQEIARWEPQLRLMGWAEERIWRRSFWPHSPEHPRGLPSILEPGDRIALADCDFIWIQKASGSLSRMPKE